jgi:hypothetical protein
MFFRRTRSSPVWLAAVLGVGLYLAGPAVGQEAPEFNVLVVGDSHIGGQGLKEHNKFYSLVRDWLQQEFGTARKVNMKVKAHGGARLNLHDDELAKMLKAGDDITKYHYQEANISQPSIRMQIDDARREYASGGDVDLVMLSGCITDVLVGNIVNPGVALNKLRGDISTYCGDAMQGILEYVSTTFPRAEVIVVGYFPIVSRKSDLKKLTTYFLRIISFPRCLQCMFTNVVTRNVVMRPLRKKIARRSDIWLRDSELAIKGAVERVNSRLPKPRIHFVPSPITAERSYGTKDTLLWEVELDQRPDDETYEERKAGCAVVFAELKYQHYGRFSRRMCELSSVAHPNVEGSRLFADAIADKLKSIY